MTSPCCLYGVGQCAEHQASGTQHEVLRTKARCLAEELVFLITGPKCRCKLLNAMKLLISRLREHVSALLRNVAQIFRYGPEISRMGAVVTLEWRYLPCDYFEEAVEIPHQDYKMVIEDGQVKAEIDSAVFDADPQMRQTLHNALNDRFLGVLLFTHRDYELSRPTMKRVHPDGRRDIYICAGTAHIGISGSTADIRVTDKNGKIITDTKRDRIEKKNSYAELVASYGSFDALSASLLPSYKSAVTDPKDELVHLYEIRDALVTKFGNESTARSTLEISASHWSRFGKLCNNLPLRQGRHRGKTSSTLRDATDGELIEARDIARAMIEAYLQYLDASTSP